MHSQESVITRYELQMEGMIKTARELREKEKRRRKQIQQMKTDGAEKME